MTMRVVVDGTHHPIHESAEVSGVTIRYTLATGEVAEVQVVRTGYALRVVMAGQVDTGGLDARGNSTAEVYPNPPRG